MPSVVITGANRGLGEAFVKYYSSQDWQVFGIVRDKTTAEERAAKNGIKNVTYIEAHITNAQSMRNAADEVAKATGGSLDLLIPNAATNGTNHRYKALPDYPSLEDIEADLNLNFSVNVVGATFSIGAFLPLIRRGRTKIIAAITTAMSLDPMINTYRLAIAAPYSVSKTALNTLIAKYNAALAKEGILVFGISPGLVGTDMNDLSNASEEDQKAVIEMGKIFMQVKPDWNGQPITADESVNSIAEVIRAATIEKVGGTMVSHHADAPNDWL